MIQFQKNNKLLHFAAILLLIGFAALTFHPLIHAMHHPGEKDGANDCPLCRFVAAFGFILFCIFMFFFRAQQERFDLLEPKHSFPFQFIPPRYGRAPPVLSYTAFL